jgi:hypothetical protein
MLGLLKRQKKELQGLVTVLDSTLIRLEGRGHEWADRTCSRAHNQGLKIHVQYNHDEDHYVTVDDATLTDVTVAQRPP